MPNQRIQNSLAIAGPELAKMIPEIRPNHTALGALVTATFMLVAWALNQSATDDPSIFVHVYYLPILLGGFFFGILGGFLAGLSAGVLCNAHFALQTVGAASLLDISWISQTGVFLFMGSLAGAMCEILKRQAFSLRADGHLRRTAGHPTLLALERDLEQEIRSGKTKKRPSLYVIEIGLGCVDEIIAISGRAKADAILKSVVKRIQNTVPFGTKIYHTHTDHFGLIVSEVNVHDLHEFSSLLIREVTDLIDSAGIPFPANACAGMACYPADGENAAELTRAARVALRMSKLTNQKYLFFDKAHDARHRESLQRATELQAAIKNNELIFYYQPKLDLRTGRVSAVEALIRWPHPSGRLLNPSEFLPLIENTPLITDLSAWGLKTAIAQIATWQKDGININLGIAVNLSAMDLQSSGTVKALQDLLNVYAVEPGRLEIEVTETTIIDDVEAATECLSKIQNLGVQVAIDDFGTGHAGLVQLRDLPVDALKIDQVFVGRIIDQKRDELIVRSAIDLGHSLGLEVIAEGVESAEVMESLRSYGCDIVQGFGIAKPMPEGELRQWLAKHNRETLPSKQVYY